MDCKPIVLLDTLDNFSLDFFFLVGLLFFITVSVFHRKLFSISM